MEEISIRLDAALSGLILPPSCFSDKTGLKTSEDAACQIPDIIAARRGAARLPGRRKQNKHLFYPNVTLLLLFLLPIFNVPNTASVLYYVTKPHYLRHH